MSRDQVHYELFVRRTVTASWALELACEDRARALRIAEEMLADNRAAAVRVIKETLDEETGEYRSLSILTKGAPEPAKPKRDRPDDGPLCMAPADLYTAHAREKIERLLEGWLKRHQATAFELLHRPDLVEQLDASGMEIQTAVQKIAIPEAQERRVPVHELIRHYQKLVERAVERILGDRRRGAFPDVAGARFAAAANALAEDPDRAYLLGCGIAAHLAQAKSWPEKVSRILDLADAAPADGRGRALALHVLEQPLGEILSARGALADITGSGLDLGGSLAVLTRLVAAPELGQLLRIEPALNKQFPPLSPEAERLSAWLEGDAFKVVRNGLARRIMAELSGPRRLRPGDPVGEIAILRALAMALTAAAGRLLSPEEVHTVFTERSKGLAASDFVESYLAGSTSALNEAQALVRLTENMVGAGNKRAAARWLKACIGTLRFETEMREGPDSPSTKLGALAELQHALARAGLAEEDRAVIAGKIGELGGVIEAEAKLTLMLGRAAAPVPHRLAALLKLACGQTGPLGPAADRAKAEAIRLLRTPEHRAELAASPEALGQVKSLMAAAGLMAA